MPDRLDAAIRARLEERPCFATHELYGDRARDANGWISHAKAAIVAVLDRHKPQRLDDEHDPYCDECSSLAGVTVTYPCRTARDIAKELGVEVDDA